MLAIGETFTVQFVWKLPSEDFARVYFSAEITAIQPQEDRYLVTLAKLIGGRQEAPSGDLREQADWAKQYWANIVGLVGNTVQLAYESADGRPLYMRLATLTGEHSFFHRHNK